MDNSISKSKLFTASCISLIVTAMTFAIRAGILTDLGVQFELNDTQLGYVNGLAFFGFPVATVIGGLLYNVLGARKLMIIAFVSHIVGLVMTIYAGGFATLLISSFFIGFANGSVEAACNPLIADMYTDNRTTMLNKFHVWFPGGIVIGALTSNFMTSLDLGWQLQIAVMIIPTLIYGYLFFKEDFPESENIETDTSTNIKSLLNPLGTTQSISCKSFPVFLNTVPCSAALILPVSINPNSPKVLIMSLPCAVSSKALFKVTCSLFFKSLEFITISF